MANSPGKKPSSSGKKPSSSSKKPSSTGKKRPSGDGSKKMGGEFRSGPIAGAAQISGATFNNKTVHYAEVEGMAMFEGDIVLGTLEEMAAAADLGSSDVMQPQFSIGITGQQFRWPNCRIPYEIDSALPNKQRVTDAIAHWEAKTSIRFVLRTPANKAQFPDFVRFVSGGGCSSQVGRRGGQQNITLGSGCTAGNAIHEIGHTVGLWHEQSREDRNTFVKIVFANIDPAMQHNFVQQISDGDDLGAYDYGSIMHYPPTAFSINGQATIIALKPLGGVTMGQRSGLSAGDIAGVKMMYPNCGAVTIKEASKDPIETIKEVHKDPIETIKEAHKDPITDTIKEVHSDPTLVETGGTTVETTTGFPGTIVVHPFDPQTPFVLASPSRAAGATQVQAAEIGSQVEQIAQAIAMVEQQYAQLTAAHDAAVQALNALSQGQ